MFKQLQLLTLTVLLTVIGLSLKAQVIFSENFNGPNPLANWTLIDNDGNTPQPNYAFITNAWVTFPDPDTTGAGDTCVTSTSWYQPAGQADDYLISPQISLTTNNVLRFDAQASDQNFPDGYEVLISTTTPDSAGMAANPVLLSIAAENASWTRRTVDLSAYANTNVYLAIRNNSNDRNLLFIDNFLVEVSQGDVYDASIRAVQRLSEYSRQPLNHQIDPVIFAAIINNAGTDTLTNVQLKYTVSNSGTGVFVDSSSISFIPPGVDSLIIDVSSFIPNTIGSYIVSYEVSHDSTEATPINNFIVSDSLLVTDSVLARDQNVITGALSIGAGTSGELGSIYSMEVNDTLTSVSVLIRNTNGNMTGQPIYAHIRDVVNGIPGTVIATTDTVLFPNVQDAFVRLSFNNHGGYVSLPADSFFVGVVEGDSALTLGTAASKFVANTNFVIFGTNSWRPNEAFNFLVTYLIRPNFGTPNILTGINESETVVSNLMVSPNPTNGPIHIAMTNESSTNDIQLRILDIQGKVVLTESFKGESFFQKDLDLSGLKKGVYFLQLNSDDYLRTRKIVLK